MISASTFLPHGPLAGDAKLPTAVCWILGSLFLATVALFYMFTYNSGYGYDALEYLVIGRAVAHGQSFYSLIPSKSPGIYYLVAAILTFNVPGNHYTVSALITSLFALTLLGTWIAVRNALGYRLAISATLLVAVCAGFMEMNFLEPESLVVVCGLAGFVLVLKSVRTSKKLPLFGAGIAIAIGVQFKSVAAFYGLGIVGFLIFKQLRQPTWKLKSLLSPGSALSAGFLTASSLPLLFFTITGRLKEFWLWTVAFPLLHYPSNTVWLGKLYTKLLWFHLLLLVSFVCSLSLRRIRRSVWSSDAATLAFFMGLASYLALVKTQSSHYCFPGAVFFSIFSVVVLSSPSRTFALRLARPARIALTTSGLAAVLLSMVLYQPQALSRLVHWRSYEQEELIGAQVRQQLGAGKAIFVRNGSLLYWVSGAEPAWRFVYFDAQTTYFAERNPDSLLEALNEPSTQIVEFDPANPGFEDDRFRAFATKSRLLAKITAQIEEEFSPVEGSAAPFRFWVRKRL